MATQTFELGWYTVLPDGRETLDKDELRQFCAGYQQGGAELEAFLNRFPYDQWRVLSLDAYDVYCAHNDPTAQMDCSPPALLGLILTSQHRQDVEQELIRKYNLDSTPRFPLQENSEELIHPTPTCPLWICEVKRWSQFRVEAVVFFPESYWKGNGPDTDSYGYPYTVSWSGSYNPWYHYGRDKSYHSHHLGGYSEDFLEPDSLEIPREYERVTIDRHRNRLLTVGEYSGMVKAYDLTSGTAIPFPLDFAGVLDLKVHPTKYHLYTKKGMLVLDENFQLLETITGKNGLPKGNRPLAEFAEGEWDLLASSGAVRLRCGTRESTTKLSDYKLSTYRAPLHRTLYTVDAHSRLLMVNEQVWMVNSELELSNIPLKKAFKKEVEPMLGEHFLYKDTNSANAVLKWSAEEQWFFLNRLVFRLHEDGTPELLNGRLRELTGEYVFHGAVMDPELGGAWLLAGLGRMVFLPRERDRGYLFNLGTGNPTVEPHRPFLELDRGLNLWWTLGAGEPIRCIGREELLRGLQGAKPFQR